jgi:ribonuclease HII
LGGVTNTNPLFLFDRRVRKKGYSKIAGVDEAGRGPLAGPVVAASCIIKEEMFFEGVNDSKLLTPEKRDSLFDTLSNHPTVLYGIGIVDVETIDEINILQATLLAMKKALAQLPESPDYILVDGNVALTFKSIPVQTQVKGDQSSQSVAAASILAKVTRDRIMREYHSKYPHFRFDKHKGYATSEHLELLSKYGPISGLHRKTFEPIKSYFEQMAHSSSLIN